MKKHAIAVMMIAVFSESVYAESTLFIPDVSPDSVTTSLSVGVLNGKLGWRVIIVLMTLSVMYCLNTATG